MGVDIIRHTELLVYWTFLRFLYNECFHLNTGICLEILRLFHGLTWVQETKRLNGLKYATKAKCNMVVGITQEDLLYMSTYLSLVEHR